VHVCSWSILDCSALCWEGGVVRITWGGTRTVLLTKRYALKVPRFYPWSWILFKLGFHCNRHERKHSQSGHPKLCPVLFADRFGLLVVMPRCTPIVPMEPWKDTASRAMCPVEYAYWQSQGLPFDNYHFNFGRLNGHLVALDYGTDYRMELC